MSIASNFAAEPALFDFEPLEMPEPETPSRDETLVLRAFPWLTFDRLFLTFICIASIGFCAVALAVNFKDPTYFEDRLISSLIQRSADSTSTASIGAIPGATDPLDKPIPAPRIVRDKPLTPDDFQIVMVYNGEAILATDKELWRVKVGSVVPGLGEVLSVASSETGGTVMASQATLRTVNEN